MTEAAKQVRIFIFIHDLAPFGAQRVALGVLQAAGAGLPEVTVCSFWGDETLAADFEAAGAKVVFLRARRYLDASAWRRLFRLISDTRPDMVQTNLAELSVPVRLFRILTGSPKVLHTVQNPLFSEPWYWRLLNIATLAVCAGVVYSSRSIMEDAVLPAWTTPALNLAIPNGIALPAAPEGARLSLRGSLGIQEGETTVCCVARLCRQKGQDLLLKALAILCGDGRRVKLLLAGDGEMEDELRSLSKRLGLEGRVHFLGRRNDIPAVLAAADIYAGPSRWEGLGIALGEAMLAGKPCVASMIPGHADILADGVTGLGVPVEDPALLARGIAALMDDPGLAAKLAAGGRELVSREFSVRAMGDKYMQVYSALAGKIK